MRILILASLLFAPQEDEGRRHRLVVHEWGTFTAVYGADGTMLEWRPLDAESDLPSFVYDRSRVRPTPAQQAIGTKRDISSFQRMETPVLYFYADREMDVDVSVAFPQGLITEWYPRVRDFRPLLGDPQVANSSLRWGRVRVMPGHDAVLPREEGDSHYYPARDTDAAIVRVCAGGEEREKDQVEKFLFYRGIGNFGLPLTVQAKGSDAFVLSNPTSRPIGHLFVLTVAKDGRGTYEFVESIAPGRTRTVTLGTERVAKEALIRDISRDLETCLVAEGLYRREATAMIRTWTDSYFEQEGTRILYVLPPETTDELLPLTISPKPVETKRVMVARVEILTPEQTAALTGLIEELGSEAIEARERAHRKIASYGRFAEPMLREAVRTSGDPEIRARAEALLKSFVK